MTSERNQPHPFRITAKKRSGKRASPEEPGKTGKKLCRPFGEKFYYRGDFSGGRRSKQVFTETAMEQNSLSALTDSELVYRCQQELPYETRAFEELVQRYQNKVFAKAMNMLKNREDAEDATQEVFVKVFNALPAFQHNASFSTWLYTITVNTCLNHIDKKNRRALWWLTVDVDELRESEKEDQQMFLLIGQRLEREDLNRAIEQVLKKMKPRAREILRLRFFDEMDYQSIADYLEINLSAAKMRLKRAKEDFRKLFHQLHEE